MDGTTSGSSVEASRLATKSHHIRYSRRMQDQDLPVSSGPPTYYAERPNGLVKRRHRRGHIKIEPTKINSAQNGKKAHLGCAHAAQPCGNPQKRSYGVDEPKRRRSRIKFEPTNVNRALKIWNAYQGLYKPRQPLPLDLGDRTRSTPIGGLLYSYQSLNNSLQNVSRDDNKSIASSTHRKRINNGATHSSRTRDLPNRVTTLTQTFADQQDSDARATDYTFFLESFYDHGLRIEYWNTGAKRGMSCYHERSDPRK